MPLLTVADLREAARGLRRTPAITISAVTCLALGLAVTTDISSAIDRALLQPLPFEEPERLVTVYRTTPHSNSWPFSAPNFDDLARSSERLSALAAVSQTDVLISRSGEGLKVQGLRVSGNLFATLGARPLRGRLLTPTDDRLDQPQVAVISEELWRSQFGGDPSVVGRALTIDGTASEVVGVLPRDFRVLQGSRVMRGDVWLALRLTPNQLAQRRSNFLLLLGRLAPGASVAMAQDELSTLFNGIVEQHPELRGEGVRVVDMQSESARTVRAPLLLLSGAVAMVLLIAATNVASLLLARGVQRRRETAVRTALGGDRWSVMRPILAETVLLAVIGLSLGMGLAWVGIQTIGALAGERIPQIAGLTMDLRVIAFAVVLSLVVALICGAVPAWRSTNVHPQDALRGGRGGGTDRSHHRLLATLVVAEVALSLVLLVGAGLVLKGFTTLLRQDPGFDAERLLTLEASVSPERYRETGAVRRFLEPALEAIVQLPGVESAGAISLLPYSNWGWNFKIRYEGQSGDDPTKLPLAETRSVTPGFFAVTGQRLERGRTLEPRDDDRPQTGVVAVVNQALATRDFPGLDPVGRRFHIGDTTFATIVGVVSDIRNTGPFGTPSPEVYFTFQQRGSGTTVFPIAVRVRSGSAESVTSAVRGALRSVDPEVAITRVLPMPAVIADSVGRPRFYLSLLAVFAAVAVALALAGVYGVMNYAVAQRTREFGIRSALGSSPARTLTLVAGQGMTLVLFGLMIGAAASVAATRLLGGLLYGVSPLDAPTWAVAIVALAGAGLLATIIPARRSSRVDPVIAMRTD